MMKTWPVNCAVLLLLGGFYAPLVYAQHDDEEVDMALLEFLADWEDDQGQWVDPMNFEDEKGDVVEVSSDE